jgi:hypothetical protein
VLVGRIKRLLARHHGGVSQVEDMAIELISQACEQRLRDLIERLAGASARRRQLSKSGLRTATSARQPSVTIAAASGGDVAVVDGDAMELDTGRSGDDGEKQGQGAKPSILINDMIYVLEREVKITPPPFPTAPTSSCALPFRQTLLADFRLPLYPPRRPISKSAVSSTSQISRLHLLFNSFSSWSACQCLQGSAKLLVRCNLLQDPSVDRQKTASLCPQRR